MTVWIILGIYVAVMIVIGVMGARKVNSLTSFVVGSRSAGPWMSAFAYGTTYFSAVLFIGYAGRSGWDFGLWAVLIGLGNAVFGAWMAWKVLADRTREVTRRLKIKTMPQMFEKRFMSKPMKIFAAIVIFIFMTPYSASVYSGLSYLCESVLHIDYAAAMLAIALISAVYLVLGGYLASLKADFIQGIVMIFGILAMIFFVFRAEEVGGLSQGLSNLSEIMREHELLPLAGPNVLPLVSLIILTSFGSWGLPQMIHKFYGVADRGAIKRGTVISTLFCGVISCGAYLVGALSRLFFTDIPELAGKANYDLIIPQMLIKSLPTVLLAVVLVLVLSASVSTLSGITLTSCSTLSMDLIVSVFRPNMDKRKTLTITRVLCLLFILFSFVIAYFKLPILMLMSFSWGSVAGAFLAPYLLGLYWKRMNRFGAWSGMLGGLGVSVVLALVSNFDAGKSAVFGVTAIASSFVFCLIGTLVGRAIGGKSAQTNESFFAVSDEVQA